MTDDESGICLCIGTVMGLVIGFAISWFINTIAEDNKLNNHHFVRDGKMYKTTYIADEKDVKRRIINEWDSLKEIEE